jgi:hypothetical protein
MKRVFKRITRIFVWLFSIAALLVVITFVYMLHPTFGAKAEGKRLERMLASPNYKNGVFVNRSFTPLITKGYSMRKVSFDFLFNKSARAKPKGIIPSVQTNLKNLPQGDWLIWFGHSSYLLQVDGLKVLVDPVFSGNASPVPGTTKAFRGSNTYQAEDMPEIDYLFISHDHYDHLDYETMVKLKGKVKKVVCGLGVGAHLERWGYAPENIIELDWDTNVDIPGGGMARSGSPTCCKRPGGKYSSAAMAVTTNILKRSANCTDRLILPSWKTVSTTLPGARFTFCREKMCRQPST